jgi:hypothetical protein
MLIQCYSFECFIHVWENFTENPFQNALVLINAFLLFIEKQLLEASFEVRIDLIGEKH